VLWRALVDFSLDGQLVLVLICFIGGVVFKFSVVFSGF